MRLHDTFDGWNETRWKKILIVDSTASLYKSTRTAPEKRPANGMVIYPEPVKNLKVSVLDKSGNERVFNDIIKVEFYYGDIQLTDTHRSVHTEHLSQLLDVALTEVKI